MSNERKRVLIIATVVKTHIMQFHIPTLKLLKDMGWETAVAARNDYSNPLDCQIPYCDQFYDIPFERIPFMPQNVECYKKLKDLIDHGNYQIIHCHTPVAGVLGRLAARKTRKEGTRVLYTAHGFHFYRGAPLKNWLMYYPIEKICSYFADDIITINREDYEFARKRFSSGNIHYLPGVGIDTEVFSPDALRPEERSSMRAALGLQPGQRMILSVGELISRKNYKTALDVIARLKPEQVCYYICGQGVMFSEIEEYANTLGVKGSVVFLGYRRDVPQLCACADVFLHTSYQEGLPVAVMEAMACGTPVVASRIRGDVDLIEDGVNGFLCAPEDADGYVEKIRCVLAEPNLAEELRSNALQKIRGFDMRIVTKQLEKIYCGVSAQDSASPYID